MVHQVVLCCSECVSTTSEVSNLGKQNPAGGGRGRRSEAWAALGAVAEGEVRFDVRGPPGPGRFLLHVLLE